MPTRAWVSMYIAGRKKKPVVRVKRHNGGLPSRVERARVIRACRTRGMHTLLQNNFHLIIRRMLIRLELHINSNSPDCVTLNQNISVALLPVVWHIWFRVFVLLDACISVLLHTPTRSLSIAFSRGIIYTKCTHVCSVLNCLRY